MTRTAMEEEGENKDIVLGGEDLFVDGKILRRTGHVFAGSRGLVKTCQTNTRPHLSSSLSGQSNSPNFRQC
jgi:hypothetical protein